MQNDLSATLSTHNDQTLFQPVSVNENQQNQIHLHDKMLAMSTGGGKPGTGYPCVMVPVYPAQGDGKPLAFHLTQDPVSGEVAPCLSSGNSKNGQCVCGVVYCIQGNCIDRADTAGCNGKGWTENVSYTLNTIDRPAVCYSIDRAAFNQGENAKFDFEISDKGTAPTLVSLGPSAVCYPKESTEPRFAAAFKSNMSAKTYGIGYEEDVAPTISAEQHDASVVYAVVNSSGGDVAGTLDASYYKGAGARNGEEREFIVYAIGNGQVDGTGLHEKAGALNCMHDQQAVLVGFSDAEENAGVKCLTPWEAQSQRVYDVSGVWHALYASEKGGLQRDAVLVFENHGQDTRFTGPVETSQTVSATFGMGGNNTPFVVELVKWIIRRLMPLECERLQGFPDDWTDIGDYTNGNGKPRKTTDSARYKALSNSIAIPPWTWVLRRVALACGADRTMASLFDGIGGFPLIWERINGKGFCLWTSEIEEFCIAVTEKRFKEE